MGQRRGLKNPWARQEDVFLVHPQNGLNGLILNWCIGACCFTPAHNMDPIRDYVYHKVKANVAKGSLGEKVAAVLLFVTDCIQFLWLMYHLPEFTTEHLYIELNANTGLYEAPVCYRTYYKCI